MSKNKNFQDKNTVSGNRAETTASNCSKSQNSTKNRTDNSEKNTADKYTAEKSGNKEEY